MRRDNSKSPKSPSAGHMVFPGGAALCAAVAMAWTLSGCGGGGGGTDTSTTTTSTTVTTQQVSIPFVAVAGGSNTPVNCSSTLTGMGTGSVNAQLRDLRFYLTNVQLIDAQGKAVPVTLTSNGWQYSDASGSVTLIDLENGQGACAGEGTTGTNAEVVGTVPAGQYVKLKATVGVPEKLNHSHVETAAAPLNLAAMGWSWQAGRKFAKIEMDPVGGVQTVGAAAGTAVSMTYPFHLASTACSGPGDGTDTCAKLNLATFTLDLNLAQQQVALDLSALFAGVNVNVNQSDAVGCLSAVSDTDCPAFFSRIGVDLATGQPAVAAQTVFRSIAR